MPGDHAHLPKLSIAAKLYTIFTLLATATVVLSGMAVLNARHKTAMTDDFERAFWARRTSSASTA